MSVGVRECAQAWHQELSREAVNLGLRGGAGIPDWVAALLPTSYDR